MAEKFVETVPKFVTGVDKPQRYKLNAELHGILKPSNLLRQTVKKFLTDKTPDDWHDIPKVMHEAIMKGMPEFVIPEKAAELIGQADMFRDSKVQYKMCLANEEKYKKHMEYLFLNTETDLYEFAPEIETLIESMASYSVEGEEAIAILKQTYEFLNSYYKLLETIDSRMSFVPSMLPHTMPLLYYGTDMKLHVNHLQIQKLANAAKNESIGFKPHSNNKPHGLRI